MATSRGTLLVADEEDARRTALVRKLKSMNYEVKWVGLTARVPGALAETTYDTLLISAELAVDDDDRILCELRGENGLCYPPVVIIAGDDDTGQLMHCLEAGAADFLTEPFTVSLLQARIAAAQARTRSTSGPSNLDRMQQLANDLKTVVLPTSAALLVERDMDRLLERILLDAKGVCHADAATLYLRDEDHLDFAIVLTDSLGIALGGTTGKEVAFPPLPLYDAQTGNPNTHNVASYVALTGHSINIADVYNTDEFDFSATKRFDKANGYRSMSTLTVPIKNDEDEIVGVLQLLNAQEPDTNKIIAFDIYQQLVIETLASQVAIALRNQEIMERQTTLLKMEYDLQVGHGIQENFLPKDDDLPEPEGWDISARLYPARQVAGDFYDVFEMTHNRVGFLVGDVCDKGVGAALFMALMRSLTRAFAQQVYPSSLSDALQEESVERRPSRAILMRGRRSGPSGGSIALGKAITLTNDYVINNHPLLGMFATMFIGMLDPSSGSVLYINGGHNPPVLLDAAGAPKERLKGTGPAVGMMSQQTFEIHETQFEPGDTLVIFSDGVPEARNVEGGFYREERMLAALARPAASAYAMLGNLETDLRAFIGEAEPSDDITMMAVRRNPTT